MRTTVAALLVGCVVLAACAPAHAAAGRQLRSEEDEAAAAGYPIQPAGMDLARIQSFVQSLVTGEAAKPVSVAAAAGAAVGRAHNTCTIPRQQLP